MGEVGSSEVPVPVSESNQRPQQRRFDRFMEINRGLVFRRPEVLGAENLGEIPIDSQLIIVTTHFSDVDLQTVESALRPRLKETRPNHSMGISVQSENLREPPVAALIKLAGREHFFGYDVLFDKTANHLQFLFNPENFKKMATALEAKTDIITAAHEPLSNIPGSPWELPKRSGLGAAYLAQMANATLLPVAVDIQTDKPVGMSSDRKGIIKRLIKGERPNVKVVIGKPFKLDKIDDQDLEVFGDYASSFGKLESVSVKKMSQDEKARARRTLRQLREQSDAIMRKIASLLPAQKRGRWNSDNTNDTEAG